MDALILLPVVPGRAQPKESAEQTTQFLFGEGINIIEKQEEWSLVESCNDKYQAWVNNLQLVTLSPDDKVTWKRLSFYFNTLPTLGIQSTIGPIYVGFGAMIPKSPNVNIAGVDYTFSNYEAPKITWKTFVMSWCNAPYQWGGKNLFGVDCSGFTQVCMAYLNYKLPRDAYQQVAYGQEISKPEEWKEGDLAFFTKNDKITHVGIVLSGSKIIHASGRVRVDRLTNEGIVNVRTNQLTHHLHVVKRLTE